MAEIMGTVTSIKRYLSPEKIELKISPDMGPENTIILPQNRRYTSTLEHLPTGQKHHVYTA